jgi:hypothetical protein
MKEMEGSATKLRPDVATVPGSPGGVDPSSALVQRRDAVLRKWLGMEVERSTVGELAERPLSERLRELEELFDAAVHELRAEAGPGSGSELRATLDQAVDRHTTMGMPFTVAVLATPGEHEEDWREALIRAAEDGTTVLDGGAGTTVAVLPGVRPREADVAVDRLRAHAWSAAGCQGRLPAAGFACCPTDGESADALLAAAHEHLQRMADAALDRSRFERQGKPAPVTPLYPELG